MEVQEGLHFGIDEDVYHSWPGASASRLKQMRQSPAHCKLSMKSSKAPSQAMLIGSLIHARILMPFGWGQHWGIVPKGTNGRTNEGKAIKTDLELRFGDRVLDHETVESVVDPVVAAIQGHPAASRLLDATSNEHREASCWWLDPNTGVSRKARIDGFCEELQIVWDIKTTTDARASEFASSLYNYGYHIQAAHYLRALRHFGKNVQHFVFIVAEKSQPFGVGVYRLTNEAVMAGEVELDRLLKKFDQCTIANNWPCYSENVEDIGLPQWAVNKINEETVNE